MNTKIKNPMLLRIQKAKIHGERYLSLEDGLYSGVCRLWYIVDGQLRKLQRWGCPQKLGTAKILTSYTVSKTYDLGIFSDIER